MTAQPQLFTCNSCETSDLKEDDVQEITLTNSAYYEPGLINKRADLCGECNDKFEEVTAQFGFESFTPGD